MARGKQSGKMVVVRHSEEEEEEEGHHGGSWKVAYADFVTAMLEPDKRDRIADFFVEYSLVQVIKGEPGFADSYLAKAKTVRTPPTGKPDQPKRYPIALGQASPREVQARLAAVIESRLADVKDQVLVEADEKSVRIEIVDNEGRPLFSRGSSEPTETAKRVLKVMAKTLSDLDNKLTITGHTDAVPFASQSRLTNWELSSFRALAARRELETWGLSPSRLALVSGAADSQLLLSQDPQDPRNRCISIRVLESGEGQPLDGPASSIPPHLPGGALPPVQRRRRAPDQVRCRHV